MPENKCWICGGQASSGEHFIKASDLRSVFGKVSLKRLLFKKVKGQSVKIPGVKSDKLKYNVKLCQNCNNSLTQRYDKAWEQLSLHLRERRPNVVVNSIVNLQNVFPGNVKQSMLYVHLFFVKQFGCKINDCCAPIDTSEIAACLRNCAAHPHVWLTFCGGVGDTVVHRADNGPINLNAMGDDVTFATWFYRIGSISVVLAYAPHGVGNGDLKHAWHPLFVGNKIRIVEKPQTELTPPPY
ncbi:hypothetical protein [Humidesulfovibrio idahonensis]